MHSKITLKVICVIAFIGTAGVLCFGPLSPPSGAVTSTNKTLAEVEPRIAINSTNTPGNAGSSFVITQPGSYYLTASITSGLANGAAITVTAFGGVTIDLQGFQLTAAATNCTGVNITGGGGVTIRNGTIWGFAKGASSSATGSENDALMLEGVAVRSCDTGVSTGGPLVMRDCTVLNTNVFPTPVRGAQGGSHSRITRCRIRQNGPNNLVVGDESLIEGCTFESSSAYSVSATAGSVLDGCAFNLGNTGLLLNAGTVQGCTFNGFAVAAINASNGSVVEQNILTVPDNSSSLGLAVNNGCLVRGNKITAAGAGGGAEGVFASGGRNTIERNVVQGFSATNSVGIIVQSAAGTGNAGNKIQDNELVSNWRHLTINAGYNLTIRNTMSFVGAGGNTQFAPFNAYGPIINCNNTDLGTVAGSTHPQANLAY